MPIASRIVVIAALLASTAVQGQDLRGRSQSVEVWPGEPVSRTYTSPMGRQAEPSAQASGALESVVVTFSGSTANNPTTLFAWCGGSHADSFNPTSTTVTMTLPVGTCEIGIYERTNNSRHTLVIRDTPVPARDTVRLALDGPLRTATFQPRDENGAPLDPSSFEAAQAIISFTRAGTTYREPFWSVTSSVFPGTPTYPEFRYDVPEGRGFQFEWMFGSWPTATTVYRYAGRLDTFAVDTVLTNTGADLKAIDVEYLVPEGAGALTMNGSTSIAAQGPNREEWFHGTEFTLCSNDFVLEPPYRQRIVSTVTLPGPAMPFALRLDTHTDVRRAVPNPCDASDPAGRYVASAVSVRRMPSGEFRSFPFGIAATPGTVIGETLPYGLAPLAFLHGVDERAPGRFAISPVPNYVPFPTYWPLPGGEPDGFHWPSLFAQHGDARPAPIPYVVRDATGEIIDRGEDLTAAQHPALPDVAPATLEFAVQDPLVTVGGQPAGVAVTLTYGRTPSDPSPPSLHKLSLEVDGVPTDRVSEGAVLHVTVRDAGGVSSPMGSGVADVTAAVRVASSGDWMPLALVRDGVDGYRASLPALDAGLYDLRITTADEASNTGVYVSQPAFESEGAVATDPTPVAATVGRPSPNPTGSVATVSVDATGPVRADLFDTLGRRVLTTEVACAGTCAVPLAVGSLAPGVYVARVQGSGVAATRRLTVAR